MKISEIIKKISSSLLAAAVFFLFSGCIGVDQENKTAFELNADGTIRQKIVDDSYDAASGEDLELYINDSINAFQNEYGAESISLEKCRVADGKVNITLLYSSAEAYANFNNVTCFNGTVKEAYDAGCDFNRLFYTSEGYMIPYFDLTRNSYDCKVLVIEEPVTVTLPGDLYIMSEGISVNDNGTISIDESLDDDLPEKFQTLTVNPVFLIYKSD